MWSTAVVPNRGVATPNGVAEHFEGGREAVANATAKVNIDRLGTGPLVVCALMCVTFH